MHYISNHTGITITIVKCAQDWQRLIHTHQYHVPIQYRPRLIQSSWVALYMPGWYSHNPHSVCYVAHMSNLHIMRRLEYLPDQPHHPHAHHLYAIITCDALYELRIPIVSKRWRRVGIHHTTWGALMRSYDLGALSLITQRMHAHATSNHDSYDLFDLCTPITQTQIR